MGIITENTAVSIGLIIALAVAFGGVIAWLLRNNRRSTQYEERLENICERLERLEMHEAERNKEFATLSADTAVIKNEIKNLQMTMDRILEKLERALIRKE